MGTGSNFNHIMKIGTMFAPNFYHDPITHCWIWLKCLNNKGYGNVWWEGRTVIVSRLMFHLATGFDLDSTLGVLHSCDNPPCFNPDHLFPGSQKENMMDASIKGRLANRPTQNHRNRVKVECKRGHPFDDQNTCITKLGGRRCRQCNNACERNRKINAR